jgi:hypothetical protein
VPASTDAYGGMGGSIPSRLLPSRGATRGTKTTHAPYRVASSTLALKGHATGGHGDVESAECAAPALHPPGASTRRFEAARKAVGS